jgi:hypothetical protein
MRLSSSLHGDHLANASIPCNAHSSHSHHQRKPFLRFFPFQNLPELRDRRRLPDPLCLSLPTAGAVSFQMLPAGRPFAPAGNRPQAPPFWGFLHSGGGGLMLVCLVVVVPCVKHRVSPPKRAWAFGFDGGLVLELRDRFPGLSHLWVRRRLPSACRRTVPSVPFSVRQVGPRLVDNVQHGWRVGDVGDRCRGFRKRRRSWDRRIAGRWCGHGEAKQGFVSGGEWVSCSLDLVNPDRIV